MLVHTHTTPGARESARVPHTYSYHTFHLIRVGRAGLTKTTHATLARGRGIVAFGLRQRSALPVTSRARAHDMLAARASPARRPPRGAVSLPTAIMPLAVSLLHVTCGVACRPWGCSIGRQPMLRYATTTHRLHCCSQPCRVGGMLVHTHTTPGARESARVPVRCRGA
jgi:hypothetical protein